MPLAPSPKGYTLDQDKTRAPMETVIQALTALERLPELGGVSLSERALPVGRAFSVGTRSRGVDTSGKGLTREQACASALMEYVERHAWFNFDYRAYDGYVEASHAALATAGEPVVEADYFLRNFVTVDDPAQLTAEIAAIPLKWIVATRLDDGGPLYYPINWHNMLFSSNGLAAGNTREEAIAQALCEVIEREDVYRFFLLDEAAVAIRTASLRHPLLAELFAEAEGRGIHLEVRELTGPLGVPCFLVRGTIAADAGLLTHRGVGQGCHPDPEKALMRACAEYFENLATMAALQTEVTLNWKVLTPILPATHSGFHVHLNQELIDRVERERDLDEVESLARPDIRDEIALILARLAHAGVVAAVVDKTHPRVGIPAVRVFAPRLRSCIATEIRSPADTLRAVYHEAGDPAGAARHPRRLEDHPLFRALSVNPLLRLALPQLGAELEQADVFGADFQENLRYTYALKRDARPLLKQLEPHNELLTAALSFALPER